jgi:hypothetical protein
MTTKAPAMVFDIEIYPSRKDPNNWEWCVSWTWDGDRCAVTGPGPGKNVLSTPTAAKEDAEEYAKTMGRNLLRSGSYPLNVTDIG